MAQLPPPPPRLPPPPAADPVESGKTLAHVVYALNAASFLLPFTMFIGVILNLVKMGDVRHTWVESHFRWQLRTVFYSVAWAGVAVLAGVVLMIVGAVAGVGETDETLMLTTVGAFFAAALLLVPLPFWYAYRVIRGWLRLNDNRPI